MNTAWAVAGGLAGLPAGTLLRAPVFRLSVPPGAPDREGCPACARPVRQRIPCRCRACGHFLGPPAALELATATVLALVCGHLGGRPETAAFAFLGAAGVGLAAIDIAAQRLPDRLTLPAIPVMAALLAWPAVAGDDCARYGRALLGGAAMAAVFLLLALARPGQMGGGDIKLAVLAGLALGWLGWPAVVLGTALGFVLSAVVSLGLIAARKLTFRGAISFGPFMMVGALLATLAAHP